MTFVTIAKEKPRPLRTSGAASVAEEQHTPFKTVRQKSLRPEMDVRQFAAHWVGSAVLLKGAPAAMHGEVLVDTSVYFGVCCRRCDNRIALVEVISGPRIYQWFVPRIPPFEVRCEHCGVAQTYRYRHIDVFEAPTLENLETHPVFRKQSLTELYRHSPIFVSLRDSKNLKGKCGICEFREICGGSRVRAYALTGDVFAEEHCCVWEPKQPITGVGEGRRPAEQTHA